MTMYPPHSAAIVVAYRLLLPAAACSCCLCGLLLLLLCVGPALCCCARLRCHCCCFVGLKQKSLDLSCGPVRIHNAHIHTNTPHKHWLEPEHVHKDGHMDIL